MAAGEVELYPLTLCAVSDCLEKTKIDIHVHLAKRYFEWSPEKTAQKIYHRLALESRAQGRGILIYVNLFRKKFVIVGNSFFESSIGSWAGPKILDELTQSISRAIRSEGVDAWIAHSIRLIQTQLMDKYRDSKEPK